MKIPRWQSERKAGGGFFVCGLASFGFDYNSDHNAGRLYTTNPDRGEARPNLPVGVGQILLYNVVQCGILNSTTRNLWRITIVDKAVIYIHGKGGNAEEAIHYKPLFSNCDVIGLDYTAQFPWEAKEEFPLLFNSIYTNYKTVEIIANSIGAYFAINALSNQQIEKAYFISPVVDMERLIADMMIWANVTEDELKEKKEIQTTFGETLSWDYLCYARENPIIWEIPTHILYGEKDNLTAYGTIFEFVQRTNSTLSIMKNGEHWFHTDEQMKFLDEWIIKSSK